MPVVVCKAENCYWYYDRDCMATAITVNSDHVCQTFILPSDMLLRIDAQNEETDR